MSANNGRDVKNVSEMPETAEMSEMLEMTAMSEIAAETLDLDDSCNDHYDQHSLLLHPNSQRQNT